MENPTEPEPYARDARNFLRKHFIGRDVSVRLEFSKKTNPNALSAAGPEQTMSFGNIALEGGKDGPQEAAEMIVRRGFATIQTAREGEERSSLMVQLLDAQEYATVRMLLQLFNCSRLGLARIQGAAQQSDGAVVGCTGVCDGAYARAVVGF